MKPIDKLAFKYITTQSKLNDMIKVNKDLLRIIWELQIQNKRLLKTNITNYEKI